MPCAECIGFNDPNCKACSGTGWIEMDVCINTIQKDIPPALAIIFDAIHALKTYNVLPYNGGWLDQPNSFRLVHDIFCHVETMVNERKESHKNTMKSMAGVRG